MNKITLFYICFTIVSQTYTIHACTAPQDILLSRLLNHSNKIKPAQVHLHVKSMPVEQGKSPEIYFILHDAQYLSSDINKPNIFTPLINNHKDTEYLLAKENNRYFVFINSILIAECETEHIPHSDINPTVVLAYLLPQKLAANYSVEWLHTDNYEKPKSMELTEIAAPKLIRLADQQMNPTAIIVEKFLNNTDAKNKNSFSIKNITEKDCDEITSKNHNIYGKTAEKSAQQNTPKSPLSWKRVTLICFISVMVFYYLINKGIFT